MVNERFRRGTATPRRSRMAYYSRRRQHRLGATSGGYKVVAPQFLRRVRNRPALRRRGYLHAMIRVVVVLGAVAALGYGARYGYQRALTSPALSIQSVRLHQVPTMLIEPVRARVQPAYGQNLLALDLDALRASIEELPAVRSAGVRRILPDEILVSVEARRPRARVVGEQAAWVIDRESVVLDTFDRALVRLPEVVVMDGGALAAAPGQRLSADPRHGGGVGAALGVLDWMAQAGNDSLPRPLRHLRVDSKGVVLVTPRLEIVVGDGGDMDGKMAAVRSLLRANPPVEPSTIDVRYRDMVVVTALPRAGE